MSAKISAELSRRLKEAEGPNSKAELPVIITVKQDSDLTTLKEKGLKIEHTFEIINAVSGTLPANAVKALARLDEVQQIDYDGEVQALPMDDDEEVGR